jgi:hypothetical protein
MDVRTINKRVLLYSHDRDVYMLSAKTRVSLSFREETTSHTLLQKPPESSSLRTAATFFVKTQREAYYPRASKKSKQSFKIPPL